MFLDIDNYNNFEFKSDDNIFVLLKNVKEFDLYIYY